MNNLLLLQSHVLLVIFLISNRAVRAMNETLKQNRLLRDRGDESSCLFSTKDKNQLNDPPNNVC